MEDNQEKKIGFESFDVKGKGKEIDRFQKHLPGQKLRKTTKVFTIIGVTASSLSMMYYLLPLFAGFLGAIIALCIFVFIAFVCLGTLFIILASEEFRIWVGFHSLDVPNFFFNIGANIDRLSPFFPIIGFTGIACSIVGLVFSIVGQNKYKQYFISYVVLNSIFLVIALLAVVFYYANGGHTFVNG